jgi:hypothetical protein
VESLSCERIGATCQWHSRLSTTLQRAEVDANAQAKVTGVFRRLVDERQGCLSSSQFGTHALTRRAVPLRKYVGFLIGEEVDT